MTGILCSCQEKPVSDPDLPSVVTTGRTTSLWVEGSFEAAHIDEEETVGTSRIETEETSFPVVTSADRIYKSYPMKIIYRSDTAPETMTLSALTVTAETAQEEIRTPDGKLAAEFSAEYPVISGIDGDVCQRINNEIKLFVDGILDEFRENANDDPEVIFSQTWKINMSGVDFAGDGWDINGNIFTVYFADYRYADPSPHGTEEPKPMMFDLRTGDRIYFSELIGDSDGFAEILKNWFRDYLFAYGGAPYGMMDADQYADILSQENDIEGGFAENERMTIYDGCVGFYLAPYQYGSFADGVRRVDVPAMEILPYLNEKGKALFEGYLSAESVPANVIEYKGKKYFDTTMWVPNVVNESSPTDGDVEFVSLFETAWKHYNKLYSKG